MLSFDQYHVTFHNLTEQRYICNYFSGDGAKEGITPFTRVVSLLKTGIWSAITFLVQVHTNILRGILWLHAFRKIYEQADIDSLDWGNVSWKSLIFSCWNRGQVVWFFGRNTSTVKSRKKAPLQRRRVQLTKEIRQRFRFEDSWFCRKTSMDRVDRRLEMPSPLSNAAFYFKTWVRHNPLTVIS